MGFQQPLGLKNIHMNIPLVTDTESELYEKASSSSSILHAFVQISQLWRSEAIHKGEGLLQPKFDKVKGSLTSGIQNYHVEKKWGDPVNGRGQNIPLVTDTGLGCTRKLLLKLNPSRICTNCPTPMERGNPHGRRRGRANIWQSQGALNKTFHWWLIPDQGCTRKLLSKLNPARICAKRPTPTECSFSKFRILFEPISSTGFTALMYVASLIFLCFQFFSLSK